MKPPPFEYHRADSVDGVVALLAEYGDEAKVLAGGQSLVPLLNLRLARPGRLIDINRVTELAQITNGASLTANGAALTANGASLTANGASLTANGAALTIGATVRHRAAERSAEIRRACPLLADATRLIGHAAIRNRGTIGGSVAHADPSAELPAVLVALDAEVEARSTRGVRTVPASALFEGFLMTSLAPDELLTAVRVPATPPGTGWSFQEFSRRNGDFAIVGVAATLRLDASGRVSEARIALSGVGQVPIRATAAEALLAGASESDELVKSAAQAAAAPLEPASDLHGSAAYRKHLAAALTERALRQAFDRAKVAS